MYIQREREQRLPILLYFMCYEKYSLVHIFLLQSSKWRVFFSAHSFLAININTCKGRADYINLLFETRADRYLLYGDKTSRT